MTTYTGLYAQCRPDGTIYSVQVTDPHGNQIPLPPDEYIRRDVQPPIEELPKQE